MTFAELVAPSFAASGIALHMSSRCVVLAVSMSIGCAVSASSGAAPSSEPDAGDDAASDPDAATSGSQSASAPEPSPWGSCPALHWTTSHALPGIEPDDLEDAILTPLPDGRVLVGAAESIYDPATDSYEWLPSAHLHRDEATAIVMKDGKHVLITGGADVGVTFDTVSILDLETHAERFTTPMLLPREGHRAVLLPDGRVMVIGGVNAEELVEPRAEIFDPVTEKWKATEPTDFADHPGWNLSVTATLWIGADDLLVTTNDWECRNYRYTPSTDTWRRTTYPAPGWAVDGLFRLADGRIFAPGGFGCLPPVHSNTRAAAIYEPDSETWRPLPQPPHTRAVDGLPFLLPCGRVVIVDARTGSSTIDIFDPEHDSWSSVRFDEPGQWNASDDWTTLADGTIMFAWGYLTGREMTSVLPPGLAMFLTSKTPTRLPSAGATHL